jgi:voltage-gated potassium channel Kch
MKKFLDNSFTLMSSVGNTLLFFLVFSIVFGVQMSPLHWHGTIYSILFTLLFFVTVMILDKHWRIMLTVAVFLTGLEWVVSYLELIFLTAISRFLIILFFAFVVVILIFQIARTKEVSTQVILSSINGYLLLGLVYSLLLGVINKIHPEAFNFPEVVSSTINRTSDYIYYGFVTFTTLGYGDISPQIPVARSMAILTSVSGQIYLAVIIALLVGKYAGRAHRE